jgi:hypothetical protein
MAMGRMEEDEARCRNESVRMQTKGCKRKSLGVLEHENKKEPDDSIGLRLN